MIPFGSKVKDRITGFSGIVTGIASYITGCAQVLVAPPIAKDGSSREAHWIDEDRLEVDRKSKPITLSVVSPGPDKPAPVR